MVNANHHINSSISSKTLAMIKVSGQVLTLWVPCHTRLIRINNGKGKILNRIDSNHSFLNLNRDHIQSRSRKCRYCQRRSPIRGQRHKHQRRWIFSLVKQFRFKLKLKKLSIKKQLRNRKFLRRETARAFQAVSNLPRLTPMIRPKNWRNWRRFWQWRKNYWGGRSSHNLVPNLHHLKYKRQISWSIRP
jgi:hypothetical protein